MSRVVRVLSAVVLLAVVLPAAPASAHATLASSSPTQGGRLEAAPAEVVFTFTEAMSAPAYVVVTPPDGSDALVGEPVVDGAEVRQELTPGGPEGTWTAAVRAVSEDGHPVTSQLTFVVGEGEIEAPGAADAEPSPAAEAAPSSSGDSFAWSRGHTDAAVGAGLFLLAGLLLLLSRRRTR